MAAAVSGRTTAAESSVDVSTGVTYVERDSGPLKADIYVPKGAGPFPAVLVVHGGAWRMGTREQLSGAAVILAENGYTATTIDYRLAPRDKWPAQIYDCSAAVRWMRAHAADYKIDPTRIGVYGYSAGGQLAALLGVLSDDQLREPGIAADAPSARVEVVVAGGAPCDFRSLPAGSDQLAYWLGGTPADKPDAYRDASASNFVTADDPPMFFFHGDRDELVPLRSPQEMVERLHGVGVSAEFYTVKDAGHIPAAFDKQALVEALAFVDHVLKGAPPAKSTVDDAGGAGEGSTHASHSASAAGSAPGASGAAQ
jgi:acetyl esterase/lipase